MDFLPRPLPIVHIVVGLPVLAALALALALLPLPIAALLLLGSALLLLALIDPIWAVGAAVLAVPVQVVVMLPGGLSFVQGALLLVAGAWGLRVLAMPARPVRIGRAGLGLALLLWALLLSSTLTPYSQTDALRETLRWSTVLLVYLAALNSLLSGGGLARRAAVLLIACLLLGPLANGLLGLWQFFTGTGPESFLVAGGYARAHGTNGQPNSFAGYMNMAWPLALALALGAAWQGWQALRQALAGTRPAAPWWPWLLTLLGAGTAALLLLAALGASFSRGGWVGAVGGLGAMLLALLLVLRASLRRSIAPLAALAAGGLLALLLLGSTGALPAALTQRASSIVGNLRLFDVRTVEATPENFAVVERMAQIQAAWRMLQDHPLTGVGPGNYTNAYEGIGTPTPAPYLVHPWYTSRGHAHNYYLHMAAEAGLIGLLAYLVLFGLLLWQALASLQSVRGWFWRSGTIGVCGIIAAVMTHNLFENLHVLNMGVQLGAMWGLLAALETGMQHER
jgi:O-antigen ligase